MEPKIIEHLHSPTLLFKHGMFLSMSKTFELYFQYKKSDFHNKSIIKTCENILNNIYTLNDLHNLNQTFINVKSKHGHSYKTMFYYSEIFTDINLYHLIEFKIDEDFSNLEYARDVQKTILPSPQKLAKKHDMFLYERPLHILTSPTPKDVGFQARMS